MNAASSAAGTKTLLAVTHTWPEHSILSFTSFGGRQVQVGVGQGR